MQNNRKSETIDRIVKRIRQIIKTVKSADVELKTKTRIIFKKLENKSKLLS